jgi:hypothetical protein
VIFITAAAIANKKYFFLFVALTILAYIGSGFNRCQIEVVGARHHGCFSVLISPVDD